LAGYSATAYALGVFGVPTLVCGDDIFFGNDRLDPLLRAVGKRASLKSPAPNGPEYGHKMFL
jgi:hypothetical protein